MSFDYSLSAIVTMKLLQVSERDFMGRMGESFVDFVGQYGYDRVLSVLGRHMRDFLNGTYGCITLQSHFFLSFHPSV